MALFDWNLIHSFLAAAETGSLSAAARRLGTSQPTVGRHVDDLEARLGVRLFDRTRKGLKPTRTGLALIDQARAMRDGADAVHRIATGRSEQIGGTVRLTTSAMLAAFVMPPILADLRRAEPAIQIDLVASDRTDNLLQREADIAVRMYRPTQRDVITRKVAEFPLGCFAHRAYLARRGTPKEIGDLTDHDVIGYDRSQDLIDGLRDAGFAVDRSFFSFRCDDHVVGFQALKAGLGIGFTQVWLARREPDLVPLFTDAPIPALPAWLTVNRDIRTAPRIRFVYDFLADRLSAENWSGRVDA